MNPTLARIESEIPRLRRYARFLCGDRQQADDLVQECLVRAINKLHTWQPGTNLGAWLFTILRNFYIDDWGSAVIEAWRRECPNAGLVPRSSGRMNSRETGRVLQA